MRKLAAVGLAGLVLSAGAFANTYTTTATLCGSGQVGISGTYITNASGPQTLSPISCSAPTLSSLGATDISSIQIYLAGSFDGGELGPGLTSQTNGVTESFSLPGALAVGSYSPVGPYTFSYSATNSLSSTVGSGSLTGNPVVYTFTPSDTTNVGTLNFTESATVTTGGVTDIYGAVYVSYTYDTPASSTPEPVSMLLLGSGLLAVSLVGRKKFARK